MLEISSTAVEAQLNVDFAEIYAKSKLYRSNQELIEKLSTPVTGSEELYFPTQYSQDFFTQCKACFLKHKWSYWKNQRYNAMRLFMTVAIGLIFGLIFWNQGRKINVFFWHFPRSHQHFLMSIVSIEITVFYRERAAGMYSKLPCAFAQVAIERIYVAIQTVIYSILLYVKIEFSWEIKNFLWFYFFIFTAFMYFTLYGMMLVALTLGHQIAATCCLASSSPEQCFTDEFLRSS